MMGASQIDRFGNQNIAFIGDPRRPKAQLLGMRGAPGQHHQPSDQLLHPEPLHALVRGEGRRRIGRGLRPRRRARPRGAADHHQLRRVISNKGVFDFETPDHTMRLRSVHPGVERERRHRGDRLCPRHSRRRRRDTRAPTAEELRLLREVIDPTGLGKKELGA